MQSLTSNLLRKLAFLCMGMVIGTSAFAQLVSQLEGEGSLIAPFPMGQSFLAPAATTIGSVGVSPSQSSTVTLHLYNNSNGSGVPAYSQTGITLVGTSSGQDPLQYITLNTPFPIVAGQTYTFIFEPVPANPDNGVGLHANYPRDAYPDGELVVNEQPFDPQSGYYYDLIFQILEAKPAAVPVAVPTLSEWGMAITVLMLGGLGLLALRRSQT